MLFRKCAILLRDEVEMEVLSYIWYVYSLIFSCMNKKKKKKKTILKRKRKYAISTCWLSENPRLEYYHVWYHVLA